MQFQGHTIDLSSIEVLEERLAVLEGGVLFDGFVHSAGILQRRPLKLINAESFDLITRVNVISGGLLVKFLFKNKLFSSDASVVFVSSVASQYAAVGNIMYMSSKGGVNSMVKGLAFELAQKGIRVNGIEPGLIKTELTGGISDEELNKAIEDYPLKRLGTTEDTNSAIQFLLSPASSWITGHLLRIDGGLTLR
jgi:3-oxoacyl-[acyl-carrier protein] reductase